MTYLSTIDLMAIAILLVMSSSTYYYVDALACVQNNATDTTCGGVNGTCTDAGFCLYDATNNTCSAVDKTIGNCGDVGVTGGPSSSCTCGEQCTMIGGGIGVCQTDGRTCAVNIVPPKCPCTTCGEKCTMTGGGIGICQADGKTCSMNEILPMCPIGSPCVNDYGCKSGACLTTYMPPHNPSFCFCNVETNAGCPFDKVCTSLDFAIGDVMPQCLLPEGSFCSPDAGYDCETLYCNPSTNRCECSSDPDELQPPWCEIIPGPGEDMILLNVGDEVSTEEPPLCYVVFNTKVCLQQEVNGNLVLIRYDDSCVLWESGYKKSGGGVDFYHTKLQKKGVLVTRIVGESNSVWKSEKKSNDSDDWKLVVSGNLREVSMKLYDNVLWQVDTNPSCVDGAPIPTPPPIITFPPKPPVDGYILLDGTIDSISTSDDRYYYKDADVYLEQMSNCNLVLFASSSSTGGTGHEAILWQSGCDSSSDYYTTRLQKNGGLLTRPPNTSKSLWKTGQTGIDDENWEFILSYDKKEVFIQSKNNIPPIIWSGKTNYFNPSPLPPSPVMTPTKPPSHGGGGEETGVVLLRVGDVVTEDTSLCFKNKELCLEQEKNGNIILVKAHIGCIIWESNYKDGDVNLIYYTKLSNKGVLITRHEGDTNSVWKTKEKGYESDDYVLTLRDDYNQILIKDSVNGFILWQEDINNNC